MANFNRSRSRTVAGPVTSDGTVIVTRISDGKESLAHTTKDVLVSEATETMDDFVTEGFHSKSQNGEVVVGDVSHVKNTFKTIGNGRMHFKRGPNYNTYDCDNLTGYMRSLGPANVVGIPAEPVPSYDMESAARLQAVGNLDRSPYSFAEDLAEMRQTLNFLKDPARSFRDLFRLFRTDVYRLMERRKYLSLIDAISDVWLQYQFAFLPLVRSASDLLEAFGDKTSRPIRRTARGKSEFSESATDSAVIGGWHSESSITVNSTVRAGILYEVSNPLNDWKYKYGLRFKDIPETLWAIFPYSFMVDRVTNISQGVRGLVAFLDPNVKILGAWTSEERSTISTQSFTNFVHPIVEVMLEMTPDVEMNDNSVYTRTSWEPLISDAIPEFRTDQLVNTSSKIADLFALVWQRAR